MKKIFIAVIIFISSMSVSMGMSAVTSAGFDRCIVNVEKLNVRSGPGATYPLVTSVTKGTELKALGRIYGWYLIQTNNDYVGMVNGWYITPKTATPAPTPTPTPTPGTGTTSSEETQMLQLVNNARSSAGLGELKVDSNLARVARIKSQDMINKNYFDHNSPTYGTPFEMMKSFGISYRSAGENIAGNSTVRGAFDAWMNSPGHRANILGSSYNYTGIGIVNGSKYGKIFTQMFVGR